jgi:hypothetical protein
MIIHLGEHSNEGGYLGSYDRSDLLISGGADYSNAWLARDVSASTIRLLNGFTYFSNNTGLTINNSFTPSVSMTITPQGNIGIGTTTPQSTLHLKGNAGILNLEGVDQLYIQWFPLGYSAGRKAYIGFPNSGSQDMVIANEIVFGTHNIILQPGSGGYVGIGTSTPGYKLQVGNAADGSQARANAWNLLSDIRYKTEIEYLNNPLDMISTLKGFYFYWNTGTDKNRQFGLSAQDVEKVLPEVVSKGTDGYLSVDYGKLVPLLIEGIKDQQQQIESYKSEIRVLQEKVGQIGTQQKEIDDLKTLVNTLIASQTAQVNK